ncbi:glycosyltransferase [Faunimonas sp. B44]|uniref:glycosyltransferase n=1 Tax=Faunimonas sp. B44 TaxID=3461493 RepID=UPI0040448202
MPDVAIVLNAHREGAICGPSVRSFRAAAARARAEGLSVQEIAILDRPDLPTRTMLEPLAGDGVDVLTVDLGNLPMARNAGVAASAGDFVAFLDADDLWGENWLVDAYRFCSSAGRATVAHPELNVVFGAEQYLRWHVDSEGPDFDARYLRVANYWTSLAFAHRTVFERYPWAPISIEDGYGYEDWHWNCVTLEAGISHRPVPGTVHFIRRRRRSLLATSADHDLVPRPTGLSSFEWIAPPQPKSALSK